jgi:hypothetical protein
MQLPDTKHVEKKFVTIGLRVMEFNTTFNNISIALWQSALFIEETRVHRENHRLVASH